MDARRIDKGSGVRKYHQYTTKQLEFLRECYTQEFYNVKDLTRDFNKVFKTDLTKTQIRGAVQRYGFKTKVKPGVKKGQIHAGMFKVGNVPTGTKSRFKKGNTPWNKGVRK